MRHDVFMSYSAQDIRIAGNIHARLTGAGIDCFMAAKDIASAQEWETCIRDAMLASDSILLLITPRSIKSSWVMAEVGAAWALGKTLIPALMFISPDQLIEPIRRFQARNIEAPAELGRLVEELARQKDVVNNVTGQWRDSADGDTAYLVQRGQAVVGYYDYGTGTRKVGRYCGRHFDRILNYTWEWLNGQYKGQGQIVLSNDGRTLSGVWWHGGVRKSVEQVCYERVSHERPNWVVDDDIELHLPRDLASFSF